MYIFIYNIISSAEEHKLAVLCKYPVGKWNVYQLSIHKFLLKNALKDEEFDLWFE